MRVQAPMRALRLVLGASLPLALVVFVCCGTGEEGGAASSASSSGSSSSSSSGDGSSTSSSSSGGGSSSSSSSGEGSTSSSSSSTSSSSSSGGEIDAGADADADADAAGDGGVCLGAVSPDAKGKGFDPHQGIVEGRVTVPGAATRVVFVLGTTEPTYVVGNYFAYATRAASSGPAVLTFQFTKIPLDTDLYLSVSAPNESNVTSGIGGLFVEGAATAGPPSSATRFRLTSAAPSKCVGFSVGAATCLARWGDTCTKHAECRPGVCDCASGSLVGGLRGNCDPATNTCADVANPSCGLCDGGFTRHESGCLGQTL